LAVLGSFSRDVFYWGGIYRRSAVAQVASGSKLPCDILANGFSVNASLLCAAGGKQADRGKLARGDRFS